MKKPVFSSCSEVQALFSLYDTNKDGSLSLTELQTALGHMFSLREIRKLFEEYDANKDQVISLTEFMNMMGPE